MDNKDLPSDSDESDEDYKPSDNEVIPSEEDSDNCVDEGHDDEPADSTKKSNKRKKKVTTKRRNKISKTNSKEDDEDSENEFEIKKPVNPVEEKQKADSLWADFMKDCGSTVKKEQSTISNGKESADKRLEPVDTKPSVIEKENKVKVTEIFEFAGEKVCVEKEVAPESIGVGLVSGRGRGSGVPRGRGRGRGGGSGSGGIASILNQLGKKNKLSTLEKSKLDWDRFKVDEGIKEDIEKHNKGKEGYLERQDFLQRSDLRQFEIEKNLRTTHRSNR